MKIIKPLRLGMLTRPFKKDQRNWLAVTALAMTDALDSDARIIPEARCWQTFADELGGEIAFDLGMPKVKQEFLVTGIAYTRHQQDKTQCAVNARVGRLQKNLLVFGDRFWIDGRASAPQPFDSRRIDWHGAFGGPGFAENPAGIGHDDEIVHGVRARRLPNIEYPDARLHRPGDVVEPAGMGPVDLQRPSRSSRLGSAYDDHWKNELFPGFARDMDWHYFNAAPRDQWLMPGEDELAGADFEIWNMHPEQVVLRGRVPQWRARCVVVRGPIHSVELSEGTFDEVPMQLSTAWFFPHLGRMALIYHGVTPVEEDDAADVTHAMIALEDGRGEPRGLADYREVLSLRCESEDRAIYGLLDEQLMPEALMGAWPELDEVAEESPLRRNMKTRAAQQQAEMETAFKSYGLGQGRAPLPDSPLEKTPTLRELPAYIKQAKAMAGAAQHKIDEARKTLEEAAAANAVHSRKAGFDTSTFFQQGEETGLKGPPKLDMWPRIEAMARRVQPGGFSPSPEQMAEMRAMIDSSGQQLLENYRHTAHFQDAADPMTAEQSAQARAEVMRIMAGTRDLSGLDLTGADLSGMDLRGARWHRALLERVDFTGSTLDAGDFHDAVLARALLLRTSMREVNLELANLAMTQCEDADFNGARFKSTIVAAMSATRCDFTGVRMRDLDFENVSMAQCSFARANLQNLDFTEESTLHGLRFEGARLVKLAWIECTVSDLDFSGAELDTCDWTDTGCTGGLDFSDARMTTTCFVGRSNLRKADFQGAVLIECNLSDALLDEADFRDARLDNTDFSDASMRGAKLSGADAGGSTFTRADLTAASFVDASLIDADLEKSILVASDFHRANLFRADLSQCLIDEATRFDGAYTEQVITTPRRQVKDSGQ
ncbi:DUF2169 domain-containing protein [Variovorax sp. 375MFSha3.1]|uniref:DUF2169 family type VI secretion system accessory protein n=1 Tax=unclassified Variovorax TaxID=663243 RepID=UPI003AAAA85D